MLIILQALDPCDETKTNNQYRCIAFVGIRGTRLGWLKSYLSDCKQILNQTSGILNVDYGVIQGLLDRFYFLFILII